MNGNQQSALAALKAVEPIAAKLDRSRDGEDRAADILELWQGTETSLRALMGGSSLSGQGLIRELRQREMISLGQAYALLEFLSARDRANRTSYRATDNDVVVAREGFRQLEAGLETAVSEPAPPVPPPMPAAPPSHQAPVATPDYSRPSAPAAAAAGLAGAAMRSTPPPPPAYRQPVTPPGGVTTEPTYTERPSSMPPNLWFIVALVVLVVAAIGAYMVLGKHSTPEASMQEAIAAMQAGKHEAAKGEFATIARDNPTLATPHVFLSRLAREEGDLGTARRELETAIRLEPGNFAALREMGLILFSTGNYELARRFFIRALEANPADNASQGYLGCALSRLNRLDEAQRFLSRAGPGSWSSCLPNKTL
jgi:tetratricopeptide (TPR) repeat protein